jgi:hypothetical protein
MEMRVWSEIWRKVMPRASRASRNSSPKEAAIANILPPLDVESGRAEIYLGINQYGKFI